jgi:hypothetical protein
MLQLRYRASLIHDAKERSRAIVGPCVKRYSIERDDWLAKVEARCPVDCLSPLMVCCCSLRTRNRYVGKRCSRLTTDLGSVVQCVPHRGDSGLDVSASFAEQGRERTRLGSWSQGYHFTQADFGWVQWPCKSLPRTPGSLFTDGAEKGDCQMEVDRLKDAYAGRSWLHALQPVSGSDRQRDEPIAHAAELNGAPIRYPGSLRAGRWLR